MIIEPILNALKVKMEADSGYYLLSLLNAKQFNILKSILSDNPRIQKATVDDYKALEFTRNEYEEISIKIQNYNGVEAIINSINWMICNPKNRESNLILINELLGKKQFEIKLLNENTRNFLHLVFKYYPIAIPEILTEIATLSKTEKIAILKQIDSAGRNALMLAAMYNNVEALSALLQIIQTLPKEDRSEILTQKLNKTGSNALILAVVHHGLSADTLKLFPWDLREALLTENYLKHLPPLYRNYFDFKNFSDANPSLSKRCNALRQAVQQLMDNSPYDNALWDELWQEHHLTIDALEEVKLFKSLIDKNRLDAWTSTWISINKEIEALGNQAIGDLFDEFFSNDASSSSFIFPMHLLGELSAIKVDGEHSNKAVSRLIENIITLIMHISIDTREKILTEPELLTLIATNYPDSLPVLISAINTFAPEKIIHLFRAKDEMSSTVIETLAAHAKLHLPLLLAVINRMSDVQKADALKRYLTVSENDISMELIEMVLSLADSEIKADLLNRCAQKLSSHKGQWDTILSHVSATKTIAEMFLDKLTLSENFPKDEQQIEFLICALSNVPESQQAAYLDKVPYSRLLTSVIGLSYEKQLLRQLIEGKPQFSSNAFAKIVFQLLEKNSENKEPLNALNERYKALVAIRELSKQHSELNIFNDLPLNGPWEVATVDEILTAHLIKKNNQDETVLLWVMINKNVAALFALLNVIQTLPESNQIKILTQTRAALPYAVRHNAAAAVELLKMIQAFPKEDRTAILTQATYDNANVLMMATHFASEMVPALLKEIQTLSESNQSKILMQTIAGWNALMLALEVSNRDKAKAVPLLLNVIQTLPESDQGKILTQITIGGWNALMLAARYHVEAVPLLLNVIQTLPESDQIQILMQKNFNGSTFLSDASDEVLCAILPYFATFSCKVACCLLSDVKKKSLNKLSSLSLNNDDLFAFYLFKIADSINSLDMQYNNAIYQKTKARCYEETESLRKFYKNCQDLMKNPTTTRADWMMLFQHVKRELSDNSALLKLIQEFECYINAKQCFIASNDAWQLLANAINQDTRDLPQLEVNLTLHEQYAALRQWYHNGQTLSVWLFKNDSDKLTLLFDAINTLEGYNRSAWLQDIQTQLSSNEWSDFESSYQYHTLSVLDSIPVAYVIEEASAPPEKELTVVAQPVSEYIAAAYVHKACDAQSIINCLAVKNHEQLFTDLKTIRHSNLEAQNQFMKDMEAYPKHLQTLAAAIKDNVVAQRDFLAIKLASVIAENNYENAKRSWQVMSEIFDKETSLSMEGKLTAWHLLNDALHFLTSILPSQKKQIAEILTLTVQLKDDVLKEAVEQNTGLKKPAFEKSQRQERVQQSGDKLSESALYNLFSQQDTKNNHDQIKYILESIHDDQMKDLLCYEENNNNALSFALKQKNENLPALVERIGALDAESQKKILKVCTTLGLKLISNKALFKQTPVVAKTFYLLELERIIDAIPPQKMQATRNILSDLYEQLNKNDTVAWGNIIKKAQQDLNKQTSIFSRDSRLVGKTGYGIGFFKPSFDSLLTEMRLIDAPKM